MATKKRSSSTKPSPAAAPFLDASLLRQAQAIPAREVIPVRVDLVLARHNAQRGSAAVLAERQAIAALHKKPELAIVERLPALADAAIAAAREAQRVSPTGGAGLAGDLARLWELRAMLMPLAEAQAAAGLLPAREVAAIRAGRGSLDAADDLLALAALFAKHGAVLRGKMGPVSAEHVEEARVLGTGLAGQLKPGNAKSAKSIDVTHRAAVNLRDRVFTLLVSGHEHTWKLGALVFGRGVDAKVPPLASRTPARPKKEPAPTA